MASPNGAQQQMRTQLYLNCSKEPWLRGLKERERGCRSPRAKHSGSAEENEIEDAGDRNGGAEQVHPIEMGASESDPGRAMAAAGCLSGKRITADGTGFQWHGDQSQKTAE